MYVAFGLLVASANGVLCMIYYMEVRAIMLIIILLFHSYAMVSILLNGN